MLKPVAREQVHKIGPFSCHGGADRYSVNDAHQVDDINIVGDGDRHTGKREDHQGNQADVIPAVTIQDAANKQLTDPIADQEERYRKLYLYTAHMHGGCHRGQGRKVNIGSKS